jgi:uncharacterized membrane protein YuzA (DUF378 family)
MENKMKRFPFIAPRPSIIGALNWSVAGFLNLDIVAVLLGADSILARVIYLMVAVVALVGLTLRCAASDARLQMRFGCFGVIAALTLCLHSEALGQAARQDGAGFEFKRKLAVVTNPYCSITTYVLGNFPEQASSTNDAANRPVIVIDASTLKTNKSYVHFLMAHECCHHSLGHTRRATDEVKPVGPQPFYYLRPLIKAMELEADACAVRILKRVEDLDAIDSAREQMLKFGASETGAYYPTGIERADNIAAVAAEQGAE